jgi:hypothetical protein
VLTGLRELEAFVRVAQQRGLVAHARENMGAQERVTGFLRQSE